MLPGFFPATTMPDRGWWEILWPRPQWALTELDIVPTMETVVDLCCGDGLSLAPLAHVARHVIAVDLDPAMLEQAQGRIAAANVTNCEFLSGDAYALAELVRRPADLVLMANTFHGVLDKGRLARAVASVLKPHGRFTVINWHRRPRHETTVLGQPRGPKTEMRMTPADLAAAVEPAKLKLVRVVELPPYHYGAIFEKPPAAQ